YITIYIANGIIILIILIVSICNEFIFYNNDNIVYIGYFFIVLSGNDTKIINTTNDINIY
ncbi:MAG: hypothetical protein ACRC1M_01305, partial [Methanobacteriaceae archaeon]